jgi:hypothetical protein
MSSVIYSHPFPSILPFTRPLFLPNIGMALCGTKRSNPRKQTLKPSSNGNKPPRPALDITECLWELL